MLPKKLLSFLYFWKHRIIIAGLIVARSFWIWVSQPSSMPPSMRVILCSPDVSPKIGLQEDNLDKRIEK